MILTPSPPHTKPKKRFYIVLLSCFPRPPASPEPGAGCGRLLPHLSRDTVPAARLGQRRDPLGTGPPPPLGPRGSCRAQPRPHTAPARPAPTPQRYPRPAAGTHCHAVAEKAPSPGDSSVPPAWPPPRPCESRARSQSCLQARSVPLRA